MSTRNLQRFGGDWTEEKLAILGEYLRAYNTALKNQPFTRIYVDAFAGTGYRMQKQRDFGVPNLFAEAHDAETQELLKGSAKLALEVEPPFDRFVFVETDGDKVRDLEVLKTEHPDKARQVEIIRADANPFLQEYCDKQDWRGRRAVVFLDPFATEVTWDTMEAIARTKAIDVWILFPLMAVNRLLANDPKKLFRDRLDAIFGTKDWFQQFYRTTRLEDIFGQPVEKIRKACDFRSLGGFYQKRLRSIFAGVADKSHVWDNSRRSPLFQLFFAAGNPKGAPIAVRIANHLLKGGF
ncbi:MAG TPA: three-Cys-motif partner protein TcmP [Phycisphaerae bacterium]|nr:three-Cys-motif partner protein TcmP [Phycisphaerae bacterium]